MFMEHFPAYRDSDVLAMPWPRFFVLYEAIAPEPVASGEMTVDRAQAIQQLYAQHRARKAEISEN